LLVLRAKPLDGRHLSAALYYIWDRLGRKVPNYFSIEATAHGPVPAELFPTLFQELSQQNLIGMEDIARKVNFYLTEKGVNSRPKCTTHVRLDVYQLASVAAV